MSLIKRAFEKRVHPSKHNDALYKLFGGGMTTHTGLDVTEETALSATAVWSAWSQLSQDVAALPLHMFQRLNPGKKKAVSKVLYRITHLQPNPEMTSMQWRESGMYNLLGWGNCYSEIEISNGGEIIGLWPLVARDMEVRRVGKELLYIYRLPSGGTAIFPRNRILHIAGFSPNGIMGFKPIATNSEAIGLSLALEEYAARFFGSGAKPPVVLEHPETLGEDALRNLKASWQEMQGGLSNSHRLAILEEGMKLHEYGVSPEDSQALDSRKFQVNEVARIFNMPVHRLKELSNATYTNIIHQDLEYAKYTLQPWLVRKEQAYTIQLLSEKEQKRFFFEHDLRGLLRAAPEERASYYQIMRQNGLMNGDEIRELENLNPIPDGLGKIYYVQQNWMEIGTEPVQPQPPVAPKPEDKEPESKSVELRRGDTESFESTLASIEATQLSYYALIRESTQRVVNKETKAVGYQVEKKLSGIDKTTKINGPTYVRAKESFINWMEGFYRDDMPPYIKKQYNSLMQSYGDTISSLAVNGVGSNVEVSERILEFVDDYVDTLSLRHTSFSANQLKKLIEETEPYALKETLALRLDEWVANRADKIAGNEIIRASNSVAKEVYRMAGYTKLQWVTRSSKPCPFCSELSGRIVGIEKNFLEADETLTAFSETKKGEKNYMKIKGAKSHPPIHKGCNCAIIPVL